MPRLQKILAQAGLGSRRACDELIAAGRVKVDGEPAHVGQVVEEGQQAITVDGRPLRRPEQTVYLLLHKPKNVVSSVRDPQGRRTVMDLISGVPQRVYPVGRLDFDSEGLLLLTNDGPLANHLLHPSHHVSKTYLVDVDTPLHSSALQSLQDGVLLEDGMTAPAHVEKLLSKRLRITIHEGRNRQIRRMLAAVGGQVQRLVRIAVGPVRLGKLPVGAWRRLTPAEVAALQNC